MSLRECLALLLGSGPPEIGCLGLAQRILDRVGMKSAVEEERAFFTAMEVSSNAYLKDVVGLGPAGQSKILAAFELGRRYALYRLPIKSPEIQQNSVSVLAKEALQKITLQERNEPQEWLGFVPVHRSGRVGHLCVVEKGARTHINVDPAELFARVLALRPKAIFLFHNHPSGSLQPSLEDLDLTQQVTDVARQFGISVLGHGIVTTEGQRWIRTSDDP